MSQNIYGNLLSNPQSIKPHMKHLTLLFATILFLGTSIPSYADSSNETPVTPGHTYKGGNKRDIPSPIPKCYISEGILHVISPDDWSFATVTVTGENGGMQSTNSGFLDEGIEVYIPAESGYFSIYIVTESGDEFIGDFTL